jgi:hypothetical protein
MAIDMPRSYTRIVVAVAAGLIVVLGGLAVYFFNQYNNLKTHPNAVSQETTGKVVGEVGKLYGSLPTNETPTLAQVSDKSKLENQEFFKNAQNGDYILIYPNAKLAVIYREKENKLINVGPVSVGSQQSQTPANGTTVKP